MRRIGGMQVGEWVAVLAILSGGMSVVGQSTGDQLERGFKDPPNAARPRVWWHWMNGNITKEGIDLDLDWMKRVGLGGFQNFDAALSTPKVVDRRLVYMTPEWKDAFLFATQKADKLGLEMAIAGSPGWSESGGPWVEPSQAMKKYVWSETKIEGGRRFTGTLAKPPAVTGPFQGLAEADPMGALTSGGAAAPASKDFYADSAVIAYRQPDGDRTMEDMRATVTSSGGKVDPAAMWDGNLMTTTSVPIAPVGENAWVQMELAQPETIRAVTFAPGGPRDPLSQFRGETGDGPVLEASDDGKEWKSIVRMPTAGAVEHTMSFAPVKARFFRLVFLPKPPAGPMPGDIDTSEFGLGGRVPKDHLIAELVLHSGARVNRFEEKAAFATLPDLYSAATPAVDAGLAIAKDSVVDLTSRMKSDGALDWTPPSGRWTVLRMGYSLLGITNHPAPPEATGPEVDKLNRGYVKAYIEKYLDNYKSAVGDLMGKRGVKYVITDSWEAGAQNWTDEMIAEFTKRRGYDPHPWMPVLTGRVVDSAEASDRFLWDLRKTIADLVAENHYGQIAESLHARGMGQYGESHESGRATIGDGMEMKRADDVPMAAMWTQRPGLNAEQYGYNADIRESASVAHIYGQNLVAAESLTAASGAWAWSPATLKPTADKELAMGLNRFVIHTSVHQPLVNKAPGLALGPFGQWFNRNETWAEQAQPWITYLSRSSYLLQQGRFVADIAYFYGEDSNLTAIFGAKSPDVPDGFNFDYVNADALIHKLSVKDGRLVTDSGMTYRVLALDPYSKHMSLPVLRRVQTLVRDGAVVAGGRPVDTPSLSDSKAEFASIVDEVWGSGAGSHSYGKGKVFSGSVGDALKAMAVEKDFGYGPEAGANLLFVHRAMPGADLYYLDNRSEKPTTVNAEFRVAGRTAELWHADNGKIEDASYRIENGRTTVPLTLQQNETVFVVFRKAAGTSVRTVPSRNDVTVGEVSGPWEVSFQPERGAPQKVNMTELKSWSDNEDTGVKYFSGHGTYSKIVEAPNEWFKPGAEMWLDLGEVHEIAEVKVNGKPAGIAWKPPYRVDVSGALKPGANTVEVTVTNLWVNRLIGDQQPDAAHKYTFTTHNPYKVTSPLLASGLIGPVRVVRLQQAAR